LTPLLRALEGEMLEEVCGTIGLVGLGAAASVNPDTYRRRLRERRVFGGNLASKSASIDGLAHQ